MEAKPVGETHVIVSRDAQPDVLHRSPLERELAMTESQADLLRQQIRDGFRHLQAAPDDRPLWGPWILQARKSLTASRARARHLRTLLQQARMAAQIYRIAAE